MKELEHLKKVLKESKIPSIIAMTPGYSYFGELFVKNIKRINLFVNLECLNFSKLVKLKSIIKIIFKDYNLIFAITREGSVEFWKGSFEKNNLLINLHFLSKLNFHNLWKAVPLINREIVYDDFVFELVNKHYSWVDFYEAFGYFETALNYSYLNNSLPEIFRIGMMKSGILHVLSALLYCKGRIPKNKEKILEFCEEKFHDKKFNLILEKLYANKHSSIETLCKDANYIADIIKSWKGVF